MPEPSETLAIITRIADTCRQYGCNSIVVLSGVAGTGKTHIALRAAVEVSGHPLLVKQIQFHSSYTYEDFIEGLRPNVSGGYEVRPGVFMEWNQMAIQDPANKYVLIIEELSRANVSAVLGEVLTYIEHRDRVFETPVTRRRLKIASNLVVLATMNPQDRSALELDDALIRRLQIIECPPSVKQLLEVFKSTERSRGISLPPEIASGIVRLFEELERRHPTTFSETMPFGHGVFANIATREELEGLWRQKLKYLLRRNPQVPAHVFAKDIEELYLWK